MLSRVGGQTENSIKSAAESLNRNSFNWGIEKMYMGLIKGEVRKNGKGELCPEVSSWLENFSVGVCLSLENQKPLWLLKAVHLLLPVECPYL